MEGEPLASSGLAGSTELERSHIVPDAGRTRAMEWYAHRGGEEREEGAKEKEGGVQTLSTFQSSSVGTLHLEHNTQAHQPL